MNRFRLFENKGFVLAALFAANACGSEPRNFGDPPAADAGSGGAAGGTGASGGSSGTGGSSDATAGAPAAGTGGVGGAGSGGAQGGTGSGGEAHAGSPGSGASTGIGGAPNDECPAFSCCIAGKIFDANQVSPLNACEACKPAESTTSFTATDSASCAAQNGVSVSPKNAKYRQENCAQLCNYKELTMNSSVSVSLTLSGSAQSRTSSKNFLELDFSNFAPHASLDATKAVLTLYAHSNNAPTSSALNLIVKRPQAPDAICTVPITWNTFPKKVECDISTAVKSWLASAPSSPRILEVSASGLDQSVSVLTMTASDGLQRPVVKVDYTATCAGNVCPKLTQ